MLSTVGSFAPGAWVMFMVVMAVVPYLIGFGLKQNQRSVMALGPELAEYLGRVRGVLRHYRTRPTGCS